jgi:hypothetical protein
VASREEAKSRWQNRYGAVATRLRPRGDFARPTALGFQRAGSAERPVPKLELERVRQPPRCSGLVAITRRIAIAELTTVIYGPNADLRPIL